MIKINLLLSSANSWIFAAGLQKLWGMADHACTFYVLVPSSRISIVYALGWQF